MPRSNMMSNSASRKGGAILFFTTRARVRAPTEVSASLIVLGGRGAVRRAGAADVDADGSVELEGAAAGGGFGVAEHHANFFADLVDEDHGAFGFGNRA